MYYARFLVFPATKMTDFSLTRVYENPAILNCSATTTKTTATTIYRDTQYCLSFFHPLPPAQLNNRGVKNSQTHVHTFAFSNLIIHVRSHTHKHLARIYVCSINDNVILFYAQTGTEKRTEIILSFCRHRKTVYASSA